MRVKLYKPFEHWNKFDNIWLISDPHFDDPDCKAMNPNWPPAEEQIKLINSKVSKKDIIIILGDIGNIERVKQIKGYKVLICGNHDKGVTNYFREKWVEDVDLEAKKEDMKPDFHHFNTSEKYKFVESSSWPKAPHPIKIKEAIYDNLLFDEVYDGPLFINDKILLSHEPIKLPFGYNIHGHCHGNLQYEYWSNDSVSINVCSDVRDWTPVRLDKVIEDFKVTDIHRTTIDKAIERKRDR